MLGKRVPALAVQMKSAPVVGGNLRIRGSIVGLICHVACSLSHFLEVPYLTA